MTVLQSARDIAVAEGLHHVYIGNVPGLGAENTNCPNCHKLVVERKGYHIIQNHLKGGHCEFCDTPVSGVW